MRKMLALLLVMVCGGCSNGLFSPDDADATLRTDRSAYAPGEAAKLELANTSDATLGFNLCNSRLERFSNTGWKPAQDELIGCTSILLMLESGERAVGQLQLRDDLRAGTYRISTSITHSDWERERVSTKPFAVR